MKCLFVEKKQGFQNEAQRIFQDLQESLLLPELAELGSVLQCYDIEDLEALASAPTGRQRVTPTPPSAIILRKRPSRENAATSKSQKKFAFWKSASKTHAALENTRKHKNATNAMGQLPSPLVASLVAEKPPAKCLKIRRLFKRAFNFATKSTQNADRPPAPSPVRHADVTQGKPRRLGREFFPSHEKSTCRMFENPQIGVP
ncbi:MAG: hypothetical protein LBT53_09135 [Puniceicoccales bacterium]|jgi:hypothetical protein|nr:hypothetical protein [Puniceicoccales bacterium]